MPTYAVVIRSIITKTETVEADNKQDAINLAHDQFSSSCNSGDEDYEQDYLSVEKIEN